MYFKEIDQYVIFLEQNTWTFVHFVMGTLLQIIFILEYFEGFFYTLINININDI